MEAKINIAAILKDKPQGTKLWSSISNDECKLQEITEDGVVVDMDGNGRFLIFSVYGTTFSFPKGEVLLFSSKEMRDWSKFAWKKGDILVHTDGTVHIIFEGFEDDTYRTFKGKYYLWEDNGHIEQFDDHQHCMETSVFIKANDDAKTYINTIEERLGGKLNLETLEIEPAQPEFKDGDVITIMPHIGDKLIYLFKAEDDEKYYGRAFLDGDIVIVNDNGYVQKDFCTARPSTEEEKQMLFDALAKKGKAWDAEKKKVVDLKPKWAPKPFDRVITRNAALLLQRI